MNKAKENAKTVQGIVGHSRVQITLDLYMDEDRDKMIAAQENILGLWDSKQEGSNKRVGEIVGKPKWKHHPLTTLE